MVGPSNLTWQQAYMVDHPISHGALFSLEYQGIRLSWFSSYLFPLFNLKPLGCPSSLLYMHQWGGVICLHIMCTPIVPNFCPLFDSSPRASSLIYPNTCWHLYLLSELTCSQTPLFRFVPSDWQHWPSWCSSNTENTLPAQGFCICCYLCPPCPSPRHAHSSSPHLHSSLLVYHHSQPQHSLLFMFPVMFIWYAVYFSVFILRTYTIWGQWLLSTLFTIVFPVPRAVPDPQ